MMTLHTCVLDARKTCNAQRFAAACRVRLVLTLGDHLPHARAHACTLPERLCTADDYNL